ncbi:MAG: OmpW/AlkL family protein [Novosphingobium sp.]
MTKTLKTSLAATAAALAMLANPAFAGSNDGKIQIKVLGTAVLPDGKITAKPVDLVPLPATTQTAASDNYVPTVAVEYFVSPNFSLETICCMTEHHVTGTTGLPGAELVSHAKLIPATVTAKLHFPVGPLKPYVGAGGTLFLWVDTKPGAATIPLGVTKTTLSSKAGAVLQAGIDIPLGDNGMGLSLDAKKYFVNTTARWYAGNTLVIQTDHKLDPWVLSAGVSFRF